MAQTPKRGLGRGLNALIPENFDSQLLVDESERVQKLAIDVIKPASDQPRKHFDETTLAELADSIRQHGVLMPIVVTVHDSGDGYRLVAGERRWRAARAAGLKHVPAIVRTLKELERLEIALVENVQRVDLNPLEQAASLHRLHHDFSLAYDEIAKRLGKAPSTVTNIVRLVQLPAEAQKALAEGKISEGHARSILALKNDPSAQQQLLEAIIKKGWSVREAERFVLGQKQGGNNTQKAHERVLTETAETKLLSKKIGTKVTVRRTAKGGKLELNFTSDDQLAQLLKLLTQLKLK